MLTQTRLAAADEAAALELARAPIDAGTYGEAHTRLAALLDPRREPCETAASADNCRLTTPDLIERARALDASALLALKRTREADEAIRAVLLHNPNYVPSPAVFQQEVIDRFTFMRGAMAAELRKIIDEQAAQAEAQRKAAQKAREDHEKWVAELEKLASTEERVVEKNSRWVALVPFGIGQFQNGQTALGVTFAVTEALAGSTSLVAIALTDALATPRPPQSQFGAANARFETYALVNRIGFGAWATITVAGIIHAEVAFVPERVTLRERKVPPRPTVVPVGAPVSKGGIVGLAGTF